MACMPPAYIARRRAYAGRGFADFIICWVDRGVGIAHGMANILLNEALNEASGGSLVVKPWLPKPETEVRSLSSAPGTKYCIDKYKTM